MRYSPLSYSLSHKSIKRLKEYWLTDSDMLAQYDNFYFYLMVALCLIIFIVVVLDGSSIDNWVKTVILIFPILIFLAPKYVYWIQMVISRDSTFKHLFSSENAYVVFRKIFLIELLSVSLVASTVMFSSVREFSESISLCFIGMAGINFLKMWLYGLFSEYSIIGVIIPFVLDCPVTLTFMCVSCLVHVVIMDSEMRKEK